jgi:hypothetical protein
MLPDSVAAFDTFAANLKKMSGTLTVPGADPVMADDAAQTASESLERILDQIASRVRNRKGSGLPTT